jgi:hypothetical protein
MKSTLFLALALLLVAASAEQYVADEGSLGRELKPKKKNHSKSPKDTKKADATKGNGGMGEKGRALKSS